ncbi:glycosyltransferase family 2 protein [Planktothrix sp. FACHB-1355]|uniref:Beta-monoglucosyldiacylglycerol synthase n=1 Tax=Aerosakkonema funiforme FACHB-1375 TaxID=2949571 RepID=A0A926VIB7_9CYAN|nr:MULTISPECIES: glycosyltransferase family 2 protein [Oscillatoriales]MBD2184511.1 glycosyltransferase family 2 protein [Aerosakkonema funiforme FACHB-1375]MBD3558032.1 glycosyltransferase family 2 protein [Planktothrix sp. FACHB-1355]
MPANSWPENNSYNELDEIGSVLSDLPPTFEEETQTPDRRFYAGRRRKAALLLTIVWSGTIALHLFSWGIWLVLFLTTLMGIHAIRVLRACPRALPAPLSEENQDSWPFVSLLVAAKNEEAVIASLVKNMCDLDYPRDLYELWVIDDRSTDKTPILLKQLAQEYDRLKVFRRPADAGGGKSGALNQVLPLTRGEIIAVFDADAKVSADMLRRVVPVFEQPQVGAVQVQKAIANPDVNFWTRGQVAEMALDSFFQQQRIAIGGIGELRGNGQFIRRSALERCGGFNEETITDDLDLTIRLHLDRWDIDFLIDPPVREEGVTTALALWHQRNRWAEGGYQRYLDYWRPILRNRMGTRKTWDMFMFWITQYFLPTAVLPDFLMSVFRTSLPVFSPITGLMLTMSLIAMFGGLRRTRKDEKLTFSTAFFTLLQTLRGNLYMLHWVVVMSSATARMSVRPKRLKWVKTVHQGSGEELPITN